MTFSHNDWNWKRIRRDEKDGDVIGYCRNCGMKVDLNDGGIYDCFRCNTPLRKTSKLCPMCDMPMVPGDWMDIAEWACVGCGYQDSKRGIWMHGEIHKRTRIVEFSRQLWPQPPKDAEPYFCYINTLVFYDKDMKTVWEQKIPEGDMFHVTNRFGYRSLSRPFYNMSVEWDGKWGWLLKFSAKHELAGMVWNNTLETLAKEGLNARG